MAQAIVELVLDEGKWLFASMLLSILVVVASLRQRRAHVTVAITANVALLVGSLVFLASGQSFEQFQGME